MEVSKKGIELIKELEGYKKEAYKCSANKLTIGYGHVIKENEKHLQKEEITLSKKEAEELLNKDIKEFEKYLNQIINQYKIILNQNQYDALISFLFNTGYLKEGMIQRLKQHNLKAVGDALPLYNKANGKELPGLTKRRLKEQQLFFT